jgi:hypothetical protein
MKKSIIYFVLFFCMKYSHAQIAMPSFQPSNYASSYNRTLSTIEVLVVGAGGGPGGADQTYYGGGGGGGAAIFTTLKNLNSNNLNIAVGGGGGIGGFCVSNTGAGVAGSNGGGAGAPAGNGGCSGGGGGGGGWSGVYSGATYYVVAGGGAGGGGAHEGFANNRVAPGGGTQNVANGISMTGGTGVQYSGDGGSGGGGGGGYYGGAGQNPNSSVNDYAGNGGANYINTNYTSGTVTYNGNGSSGNDANGNAGAAVTVANAANFGYTNNKGGGGQGPYNDATHPGNVGTDGIVIIRYKGPQIATGGEVTTVNGYTVHTFTTTATLSFVVLPVKGAMAHYMANEFASGATPTSWTDQSGNGYNATMSGITTAVNTSLKNNMVIQGSSTSSVTFPIFANWTANSKYTIFVVERYTTTTSTLQKRIITDYTSNNWLTGHWMTHVGVSFHNNWITDQPNGITTTVAGGTDWILFTDQSAYARCNGTVVSKYLPGANIGFNQLGINTPGWSGEKSNFEMAEFIIYPRELNSQEINFVETYLINKYGVAGSSDGLMLNLDASNKQSFDGNGTTWSDLISANEIQWSSNAAPIYKLVDNISCFSTTNSITTQRAILSSGYTNLREGNGAYSVMAIFKPNTLSTGMLVSMGPATSTCDGSIIHPIGIGTGGKFAGGACGGLGTWGSTTGVTPTTDKFWCVTTTFSGGTNGTETVYVNGGFDKSATMNTNTPTNSINKFDIGWMRDNETSLNMDANVAVILYYNRALGSAEVLALYNKYKLKLGLP